MFRVRRFSVINTANTVALMYFAGFLIIFVPVALILSVARVSVTTGSGQQATFGVELVLLLILPILYGLAGWVFTAIFCLLYNLAARFTGGIGLDVWRNIPDAVAAPRSTQAPPPASSSPPLQG
jgi:hypothetical protein